MSPEFNEDKQHTLARSGTISGYGLHTGIKAGITLKPGRPDSGIRFQRIDLPDQPVIPANCDLVSDTFRCTTLSKYGASVSTVEHILAALTGLGVDNCLIEINGPEVPILDGCCQTFVQFIEQAGVFEQAAEKIWYSLDTEIAHYCPEKNVHMFAFPSNAYSVETRVDFKNEMLEDQRAILMSMAEFREEISPSRTYCLVRELEMLLEKKMIQGDIMKNVILVVDQPVSEKEIVYLQEKFNIRGITPNKTGYLHNLELRFNNEIARHKLLDIIGDLSLTGFPIRSKILGIRPGHSTNVVFAKKLRAQIKKQISAAKAGSAFSENSYLSKN